MPRTSGAATYPYRKFVPDSYLVTIEQRITNLEQAHAGAKLNALAGFDINAVSATVGQGQMPTISPEGIEAGKAQWQAQADAIQAGLDNLYAEYDATIGFTDQGESQTADTPATEGS